MEKITNYKKRVHRPSKKSDELKKIYWSPCFSKQSLEKQGQPDFGILEILKTLSYKSYYDPQHRFNRLMRIISDKNFLIHAMSNVSNNKGATTAGVDEISSDGASLP